MERAWRCGKHNPNTYVKHVYDYRHHVLLTFVTIIPICWYRGITYTQLHSMETLSWRILWWVVGGVMCIAVWSDIVIRFALNHRAFDTDLIGLAVAIYGIFLWSRCVHTMVRK